MGKQYFDGSGRPVNQFGTPVGAPTGADRAPVDAPVHGAGPLLPQSPFAPPPRAAYGAAPTPRYPAPQYPAPQYPASGPYAAQKPGMPTIAKLAIAAGAALAGLVILGILAAIAIPVFLNQKARADADRVTVSLPGSVAGYQRMSGSADTAVQGVVSSLPREAGSAHGAAYGVAANVVVVVIAGHQLMRPDAQTGFLTGVARSEAGAGIVQVPVDPGPLGGQMRCGAALDGSRTDCAFVDAGAYGVIDVAVTGASAVPLAQQVRAAVETRH
jgi:hypothetical protein